MKKAAEQIAGLIAFLVFVTIFIVGYRFDQPFTVDALVPVLIKALIGAALFHVGGIIIGDIIIKGVIEDLDQDSLEPLQGGFEQRIHELKKKQRVAIVERQLHLTTRKK